MASKHIYTSFYLTKMYMQNAETDAMTHSVRVYFYHSERLNDTETYTLQMRSHVGEADIFHVILEVAGSPVYVSGKLHVNYHPCRDSDAELDIERKAYPPGKGHDILSGKFDELFKWCDDAEIVIDLVLEPIPDKSSIALPSPTAYEFAELDTFDVAFAVEGDKVPAHRVFLAMISPVFRAMFSNDTKEAQTGVIEITDFDMVTVTNAMNFCYGNDTGPKSVSEVLSISKFADKYDIQPVIKHCEEALSTHITLDSFCNIADYVWTFNRDELKPLCIEFIRENSKVVFTPAFAGLPLAVREGIIQEAVVT